MLFYSKQMHLTSLNYNMYLIFYNLDEFFTTINVETGIYIVHSDHFPPPSFEIKFFSPTNKFAAGGAKPKKMHF